VFSFFSLRHTYEINPKNLLEWTDLLMNKLNIDNTLTKPIFYKFPTVKDHTFPKKGYNYQSDLLMLPTTKLGYKYLLTMIDIWSNYCDFEPIKNKQADTVSGSYESYF